jgi:PAS domain S-box-containing protein
VSAPPASSRVEQPSVVRGGVEQTIKGGEDLTRPRRDRPTGHERGPGSEQPALLSLIQSLKDYAVARVDLEGRVVAWNHAAARLTGYPASEILGAESAEILRTPSGSRARVRRVLDSALASGRSERRGWLRRRDGSLVSARSVVTPVPDDSGKPTGFLIVIPSTETSVNKEEADRVTAVLEISQAILAGQDPDAVLRLIPARARVLLHADFAAVFTPEPGGEMLVMRSAAGLNAGSKGEARVPVSSTVIGRVFRSGRPRSVRRVQLLLDDGQSRVGRPVGPVVMVPLTAEGTTMGLLMAGNQNRGTAFLKKDIDLLRLFAGQSAIALVQTYVRRDRQRLMVMEERERLGRELHDGAIQSLYAVTLGLAAATARTDDVAVKGQMTTMVTQIDSVIMDLRNHIFELRPTTLAAGHLDEALTQLVREFALRTGIATAAEMDPDTARRLSDKAHDVVQIVKEALSNVGRHARPRSCKVTLRGRGDEASISIEDDGAGFEPALAGQGGQGLRNVSDRVSQLGGQLRVDSAPNAGTAVRIDIPLKGQDETSREGTVWVTPGSGW